VPESLFRPGESDIGRSGTRLDAQPAGMTTLALRLPPARPGSIGRVFKEM